VEREIWNFAYGGNMNPRVLSHRRGIVPRESAAGRLRGYRLVFNTPGVPLVEPAFANVETAAGSEVHGVLHRLTFDQMARLDLFEGGGKAYRHLNLEVQAYDGRTILARVYLAIRVTREKKPSCRYLNILREGARHHRLHPDYLTMLETHPCGSAVRVPDALFIGFERILRAAEPVISWVKMLVRRR
jgi:gamma-glutamylcyclotransferase (GGCT)/AIG2-like uncharacterized protein YtfP